VDALMEMHAAPSAGRLGGRAGGCYSSTPTHVRGESAGRGGTRDRRGVVASGSAECEREPAVQELRASPERARYVQRTSPQARTRSGSLTSVGLWDPWLVGGTLGPPRRIADPGRVSGSEVNTSAVRARLGSMRMRRLQQAHLTSRKYRRGVRIVYVVTLRSTLLARRSALRRTSMLNGCRAVQSRGTRAGVCMLHVAGTSALVTAVAYKRVSQGGRGLTVTRARELCPAPQQPFFKPAGDGAPRRQPAIRARPPL